MMCRFALALTFALGGCARVSAAFGDNLGAGGSGAMPDLATPGDAPDLGEPGPSSSPMDLATAASPDLARPADLAMPRDLALPPDLATPPDFAVAPGACHLVINEILTGTTQTLTEEFVELYNPCPAAVTVDGWKLVYRAATNTADATTANDSSTLYTFAGNIAAGTYRVLGGTGYAGAKDGALVSGIAASGAVALRNAGGTVVDSVAWGTITSGNVFVESSAVTAPPTAASPGDSIERHPNGADSDHNATDFQTATAPTPGAANH